MLGQECAVLPASPTSGAAVSVDQSVAAAAEGSRGACMHMYMRVFGLQLLDVHDAVAAEAIHASAHPSCCLLGRVLIALEPCGPLQD
mgnify:CR=1 FL=1